MTEEPKYLSGKGGVTNEAASEIADVSKSLIGGITPADKGWILGFIVVVFLIVASDVLTSKWAMETSSQSNVRLTEYLIEVEKNRAEALERQAAFFGDHNRRAQETIRGLTEAVARDSERAGMAAMTAIDRQSVTNQLEAPSLQDEVPNVQQP